MNFYGYEAIIAQGTWQTIQLAILSFLAALSFGIAGVIAKLSHSKVFRTIAKLYTTLVRAVPDLVLMLLIFYGLQLGLNQLSQFFHWLDFSIDPFLAAVTTLGFIYGAYFTETFRGAYLAIPKGQLEAGLAFGLSYRQIVTKILMPQMLRHAIPGINNNWQIILKATALVSIIGLSDLVKATQDAGYNTQHNFFFIMVAGIIYLLLSSFTQLIMIWLEKKTQHCY